MNPFESLSYESVKMLALNWIECEFIQLKGLKEYAEPLEVEKQKGRIIGFATGMNHAGVLSMAELKTIWDDERLK